LYALGPLDPPLFTWSTGRVLEGSDDEGIAVTLADWLGRVTLGEANGEICLAKDIARAIGVDVFLSVSARKDTGHDIG
jgi:hypothetical protein